ncbi:MAG: hypothetical protein KDB00_08760 [Planctomycetales bacterium]|nr:hypothetical protein [Planctomycetales bacterium]
MKQWQVRSKYFVVALGCIVFVISGCGSSTDNQQTSTPPASTGDPSEQQNDAVAVTQNAGESSNNTAEGTRQSDSNAIAARAEQSSPEKSSPVPKATESGRSENPDPVVMAKPQPVDPAVAPPTADQLARWERPVFEPFELLACRERTSLGIATAMMLTPDGQHVLAAGQQISLFPLDSDQPNHVFVDQVDTGKQQIIKSLAIAPNGQWFAAGDSEGLMRIFDLGQQTETTSKQLYPTGIALIAIAPDGNELATASYTDEISIWSSDSLQLKRSFKVDTNNVSGLAYIAPNQIAVAGETTTSWDTEKGVLLHQLSAGRYCYAMARSGDGKLFVFAESDGLQLWDVAKENRGLKLFDDFANNELVAFSPNQNSLLTANGSNLRVWDLAGGDLADVLDTYGSPIVGIDWIPGTERFVVGSSNGTTRVWGSATAAAGSGLRPLIEPANLVGLSASEPANPNQAMQAIDLRVFPRLNGGKKSIAGATQLMYTAPATVEEAQGFHRYHLGKLGWTEKAEAAPTPGTLQFQKQGFMLSLSCYSASSTDTMISLSHVGNYDLRFAPKFDAAPIEQVYENENTAIYRTKADLLQIETNLIRKFHADGWTAYSRLHTGHREEPDARSLAFLRNGVDVQVSVSRFPADPSAFTVQYSRSLQENALPIPSDCGFVEFDGSTRPLLVANTSLTLAQAGKFYETELVSQGWLAREAGRVDSEESIWMPFVQGQKDLLVGLIRQKDGRTLIRVGDDLDRSSWQLSKPKPVDQKNLASGIQAADFPIMNAAAPATYDVDGKQIQFLMDETSLVKAGETYEAEFIKQGWKTEGAGIREADYVFITFVKGGSEFGLRARLNEGKAALIISGDGILWDKPLPTGDQVISYETWQSRNHYPAGLDRLDQYQKEMEAIAASK